MAQMDRPIGVWGAVMEQVLGRAAPRRPDLPVKVHLRPLLEAKRLILRQVGLHGEGGFGQRQGLLQLGYRQPPTVLLIGHVLGNFFRMRAFARFAPDGIYKPAHFVKLDCIAR